MTVYFAKEKLLIKSANFLVIYVPLGRWNARELVDKGFKQECFQFRFYIFEVVAQHTRNVNATSIRLILDLAELTYYKCASLEGLWHNTEIKPPVEYST